MCSQFVRIPPGSVLQLLYPCQRFSPDRCLICGGSFADHLTLWWSPHLYTPLDRLLDATTRDGIVVSAPVEPSAKAYRGRRRLPSSRRKVSSSSKSVAPAPPPPPAADFAFHRRYVRELEPHQVPPSASQERSTGNSRSANQRDATKKAKPQTRYFTTVGALTGDGGSLSTPSSAKPSAAGDAGGWESHAPWGPPGGGGGSVGNHNSNNHNNAAGVLLVPRLYERTKPPPYVLSLARFKALMTVEHVLLPLQELDAARARTRNSNDSHGGP